MIAFGKDKKYIRFNPVLGSAYKLRGKTITFVASNDSGQLWDFETVEQAEEALEWLDSNLGVNFLPSSITHKNN